MKKKGLAREETRGTPCFLLFWDLFEGFFALIEKSSANRRRSLSLFWGTDFHTIFKTKTVTGLQAPMYVEV